MGLGRANDHTTVNFGDRFDDPNPAPGQVDPARGQGHELAPAQAGVGQDLDERLIGHGGLGQRLYLIMSEEALGCGDDAGEGYVLGDVPDESSIADGRCESQRQDAVGVPDGCRSKSLAGQAVHPTRNVRVGDPGQGREFLNAAGSGDGVRPRIAPSSLASAAPEERLQTRRDRGQLDRGILQHQLQPDDLSGPIPHQLDSVAGQHPQPTNLRRRHKRGPQ